MRRICSICARGGSKGVKNKNIRMISGKPLIAYSLLQAKESGLFDVISVSSDSPDILEVAKLFGADLLVTRPSDMATDRAPKFPVIQHCISRSEEETGLTFDSVVDLDATSPLRNVDDIRGAVSLLESTNCSNVITGSPARRSPYFNLVELNNDGFVELSKKPPVGIARRQDSPKCFDMNASIYVWRRNDLFNQTSVFNTDTRLFVMPEERSIDIDSELDFEFVEFLLARRSKL